MKKLERLEIEVNYFLDFSNPLLYFYLGGLYGGLLLKRFVVDIYKSLNIVKKVRRRIK